MRFSTKFPVDLGLVNTILPPPSPKKKNNQKSADFLQLPTTEFQCSLAPVKQSRLFLIRFINDLKGDENSFLKFLFTRQHN